MLLNAEKIGVFAAYEWINPLEPFARALEDWDDALAYDSGFQVSVGDIAATCGSTIALKSIPDDVDRRGAISLMIPALTRMVRLTPDQKVHRSLNLLRRWAGGDKDVSVEEVCALVNTAADHKIVEWPPLDFASPWPRKHTWEDDVDDQVLSVFRRASSVPWILKSATDYAAGSALETWREDANDRQPGTVAQKIIDLLPDGPSEAEQQVADILALSPLHSLERVDGSFARRW
ncbi:hypothetical protein [Rhizobium leguminosarum]|uniref:hypothetical protein n=1 Tax=Rhizobium leguminosarum TaxID=384 RepID=UPI001AE3F98F|nr:hypothetical protein [Rhizobium leguminosarum]MBP2446996.1 hypothetical protein [Rhizobium leguminosarum]